MRNIALEHQLSALGDRGIGPLAWWRTLSFADFCKEASIVSTAAASIVSATRLVPPELLAELTVSYPDELAATWNDISMRFFALDAMQFGLSYEIGGTAAALSALQVDALGTIMLLKALAEPYVVHDPDTRIWVAGTWLADRGSLLNQTVLSEVDWWQSARGYQHQAFDGEEA